MWDTPERIWVTGEMSLWQTSKHFTASNLDHSNDDGSSDYPEYVRSDLFNSQAAEIAKLRAALAVSDQYWRGNDISPTDVILAINAALTPSRHTAGSPIPLDGATRTEPGFDAGRLAPLAASAPDTVAGAAQ